MNPPANDTDPMSNEILTDTDSTHRYYSLHIEMQLVNETINPSTKAEMIIRLLKQLQIHFLSNKVKHLLVLAFHM